MNKIRLHNSNGKVDKGCLAYDKKGKVIFKKEGYFVRLKSHPGLGVATTVTMFGFLAGASNTSFPEWWQGGLFGLSVAGVICWSIVLISNIKAK